MTGEQYYKAVRPDGTSFYDQRTKWQIGKITRHTDADLEHPDFASRYLSVSISPTDCTGFEWPARLFRVVPVRGHKVITPECGDLPNKRASDAWKPVEELPAHQLFGPQGEQVISLITRAHNLTVHELDRLPGPNAAWFAAVRPAAWLVARDAAWFAAVRAAAWLVAQDAARALVARDLISTEYYNLLSRTWREIIGPIHPDDPIIGGESND